MAASSGQQPCCSKSVLLEELRHLPIHDNCAMLVSNHDSNSIIKFLQKKRVGKSLFSVSALKASRDNSTTVLLLSLQQWLTDTSGFSSLSSGLTLASTVFTYSSTVFWWAISFQQVNIVAQHTTNPTTSKDMGILEWVCEGPQSQLKDWSTYHMRRGWESWSREKKVTGILSVHTNTCWEGVRKVDLACSQGYSVKEQEAMGTLPVIKETLFNHKKNLFCCEGGWTLWQPRPEMLWSLLWAACCSWFCLTWGMDRMISRGHLQPRSALAPGKANSPDVQAKNYTSFSFWLPWDIFFNEVPEYAMHPLPSCELICLRTLQPTRTATEHVPSSAVCCTSILWPLPPQRCKLTCI